MDFRCIARLVKSSDGGIGVNDYMLTFLYRSAITTLKIEQPD